MLGYKDGLQKSHLIWVEIWQSQTLSRSAMRLSEEEDQFCWSKNPPTSMYKVKLGYADKILEEGPKERDWWRGLVWKLPCLLKTRIFVWLVLANKLLTWDNEQKRSWVGPGRCILCKKEESIYHLFVTCSYARDIWKEIIQGLVVGASWNKP